MKNQTFAINGEVIYLGNTKTENNFRDKVADYLNTKTKINEKIKFVPFGLINTNYSYDYMMQVLEINNLSKIQIPYTIHSKLPNKDALEQLYKKYRQDYQIDGLVITTRDKSVQIAYKFKEE